MIAEKYLIYDFMKNHPDYEKGDWFSKYMNYNFVECYVSWDGCDDYVFRSDLYILRSFVKDTNYDYEKFKDFVDEFDIERQNKHLSWLCALDKKAMVIKEKFEKEYNEKVPTLHWKKLKKYYANETSYQNQLKEFRCSSFKNEMYFQKYKKQIDDAYNKSEKQKNSDIKER